MTRDEQRAVRAVGGWMILDLLANPEAGWAGPEAGGSSTARGWPDGHGFEYSRTRVRILAAWPNPDTTVVEVKWSNVARHAKALSPDLAERLRAHRVKAREHQAAYPSPYPSIGRPYAWDMTPPGTPEQHEQDRADLAAANERMQRERETWYVEGSRLRETEATLLDEAFPLVTAEPEFSLLSLLDLPASP